MTLHYVNLRGIPEDILEFFGIQIVWQDDTHAMLTNMYGDEYVVEKESPHIYIDDPNDAKYLSEWAVGSVQFEDGF